jgi:hypothetical protein
MNTATEYRDLPLNLGATLRPDVVSKDFYRGQSRNRAFNIAHFPQLL